MLHTKFRTRIGPLVPVKKILKGFYKQRTNGPENAHLIPQKTISTRLVAKD